jgi:hypothetical protein
MPDVLGERRFQNGLTYDGYRAQWHEQKDVPTDDLDTDERRTVHFLNYNWERQAHIHDAYTPSEALRDALSALDAPQRWMVLTEPWCGDSAFLLPVIAEAAALTDAVTLRILLRDDNLDLMDQYLTDGSRSIPKLVAFGDDGTERFTWGPRPEGAAQTFAALQEEHDDKMEVISQLIDYYEDGGWTETDPELATAIQSAVPAR